MFDIKSGEADNDDCGLHCSIVDDQDSWSYFLSYKTTLGDQRNDSRFLAVILQIEAFTKWLVFVQFAPH